MAASNNKVNHDQANALPPVPRRSDRLISSGNRFRFIGCLTNVLGFLLILISIVTVLAGILWYLQKKQVAEPIASPSASDEIPDDAVRLVITEPFDGELSTTGEIQLSGKTKADSWFLVAINDAVRPMRANERGLFGTTLQLEPGINRLTGFAFPKNDYPQVKDMIELYLPNIQLEAGEEAWVGQLRSVQTSYLSFSAHTGSYKGQLVRISRDRDSTIYDGLDQSAPRLSASSLTDDDFFIIIGRVDGERHYAARLMLRAIMPAFSLAQINHNTTPPWLDRVQGLAMGSFDELATLQFEMFDVVQGYLKEATLQSAYEAQAIITFGKRDQQTPSTVQWSRAVSVYPPTTQ